MFSSCGPDQWRLNGPDALPDAKKLINAVPVTDMMRFAALLLFLFLLFLLFQVYLHPHIFGLLGVSYIFFNTFYKNRA